MSAPDPETANQPDRRQGAEEMWRRMQAASAIGDEPDIAAYVVAVFDPETGATCLYGPFPKDSGAAMLFADKWDEFPGEPRPQVRVQPVYTPK